MDENHINAYGIKNVFETYTNLTDITISFKTDKYIKSINSDEKKGNTYYWYINKENYKDKSINITFTDSYLESISIDEDKNVESYIDVIIIIIVLIIMMFVLVIYTRYKKTNK